MRYALFSGYCYYPGGGWSDFQGVFSSEIEALDAKPNNHDWYQIVDLSKLQTVREG